MRSIRLGSLIALALILAFASLEWWQAQRAVPATEPMAMPLAQRHPAFLPPEALATLELIRHGGPFPYRQDGRTFENRERLLPQQRRGYYREYTVDTPGSPVRGARRIVTGGDPPKVIY